MQRNLVQFFLTSSLFLLNACSFYKSEGRKNFENQAPAQVRTLSFEGCHSEAPQLSSYETLSTPQGKKVYAVYTEERVVVYAPLSGINQKSVCAYSAPNQSYWLESKELFLTELDTISID